MEVLKVISTSAMNSTSSDRRSSVSARSAHESAYSATAI